MAHSCETFSLADPRPGGGGWGRQGYGLKKGGMGALAVELWTLRSMARCVLAASLLNLSLLKTPSSPGEG